MLHLCVYLFNRSITANDHNGIWRRIEKIAYLRLSEIHLIICSYESAQIVKQTISLFIGHYDFQNMFFFGVPESVIRFHRVIKLEVVRDERLGLKLARAHCSE